MMREPRPVSSKTIEVMTASGPPDAQSTSRRVSLSERSAGARAVRMIQALYDAAQTGRENTRHWANADALSADSANSPQVRQVLRSRARYEVANNSYARGIANTLANYVVGTGPRLQLLSDDTAANRKVERMFNEWACEARLCEKLWTMRVSQIESGEAFGMLATNPRLDGPVQLDLRVIEADQVATPYMAAERLLDPYGIDGIEFDQFGNPLIYHVLRSHPGNTRAIGGLPFDHEKIDSEFMIHLFKVERPGQSRGIPEITAALPLFAMLRRYTLATLSAAENAASIGGVLHTTAPGETIAEVDPLDEFELDRSTFMSMPEGWTIEQMKAEQPVEGYSQFKKEILNEIARVLDMPFNVAAGNSSGYNYSSGRLDHQSFFRTIRIDQAAIERRALRRIFAAWLAEASLVSGLLPQAFRTRTVPEHRWFWDGLEHVDPIKESTAQGIRLANGTSTLAGECARQGTDWEEVLAQRAREIELCKRLGVPLPPTVASAAQIMALTDPEEQKS